MNPAPRRRGLWLAGLAVAVLAPLLSGQLHRGLHWAGGVDLAGATDGQRLEARLHSPQGLALAPNGDLWIADTGNHTIRHLSASGELTTVAGLAGVPGALDGVGAEARFRGPLGLALTAAGSLVVVDTENHAIRLVAVDGTVSTLAGVMGEAGSIDDSGVRARFNRPTALTAGPGDTFYITDGGNYTVRRLTLTGAVTTLAGQAGLTGHVNGNAAAARFGDLAGITRLDDGTLMVSEVEQHRVRSISPTGIVSTRVGELGLPGTATGSPSIARLDRPVGLFRGPQGSVYLSMMGASSLRELHPSGEVSALIGIQLGIVPERLVAPTGLVVTPEGRIFVANTGRHTLVRFALPTVYLGALQLTQTYGQAVQWNLYFQPFESTPVFTNLPAGLTYQPNVRALLGSPNAGSYPIGLEVIHPLDGTATVTLQLTIEPLPVVVTVQNLVQVYTGTPRPVTISTNPAGVPLRVTYNGSEQTPIERGVYVVRATVVSANHTGYQEATLFVRGQQTITFPELAPIAPGTGSVELGASATSGLPVSYTLVSGPGSVVGSRYHPTVGGQAVIRASQAGEPTMEAAPDVERTLAILPVPQALTVVPPEPRAFDSGPVALNVTATSGLSAELTVVSGPGLLNGSLLTATGAGEVRVRATQAGSVAYQPAEPVEFLVLFLPGTPVLTFDGPVNRTFSSSPVPLTASASSGAMITFSVVSGPATVEGNHLLLSGTGTVVVRAEVAATPDYLAASREHSFVVGHATQSITFPTLGSSRTFGQPPITLQATASSGLPVTYTVISGPGEVVDGNQLHLLGAGSIWVRAEQPGDHRYAAATGISRSVTVNQALAALNLVSRRLEFTGAPRPVEVITNPAGLAVTVTYSGQSNPPSALGSYSVSVQVVDPNYYGSASYTLVIGHRLELVDSAPALGGGVVASNGHTIQSANTQVTLLATPPPGWRLDRWTGDIPPELEREFAPVVLMDQGRSIQAEWLPNDFGPREIDLSRRWFWDNAPLGTVVGRLSAVDADPGDRVYFVLTGKGSDDSRFAIQGDQLLVGSTAFNYNTRRFASVGIAALDYGGRRAERVITIDLMDATPAVSFRLLGHHVQAPGEVSLLFQLKNYPTGTSFWLPKEVLTAEPHRFVVRQDGVIMDPVQRALRVEPLGPKLVPIRMVLLVETSDRNASQLGELQAAVTTAILGLPREVSVALDHFGGQRVRLQDFTLDRELLVEAAARLSILPGPVDLHGAMDAAMDTWTDRVDPHQLELGYLVVGAAGPDEANRVLFAELLSRRDAERRWIHAFSLNLGIDDYTLRQLANLGYQERMHLTHFESMVSNALWTPVYVQHSALWLTFTTPATSGLRWVTVDYQDNSYRGADAQLGVLLSATGLTNPGPALLIDRSATRPEGVEVLALRTLPDQVVVAQVRGAQAPPELTWEVADPDLVQVQVETADGSRVRLTPLVRQGETTITVHDLGSGLQRTLPLVISTAGPSLFDRWLETRNLSSQWQAPDDQWQGDGWPLLLKYALGLDPHEAPIAMPAERDGDGGLRLTYVRRRSLDLTYVVEATGTPGDWSLAGLPVEEVAIEPLGGNLERVTVRVPREVIPDTGAFLRLRVSLDPPQ